jgi:hypothetical protein
MFSTDLATRARRDLDPSCDDAVPFNPGTAEVVGRVDPASLHCGHEVLNQQCK